MPSKPTNPVNADKLRLCLARKGIRITEASLKIGHCSDYLTTVCNRGTISTSGIVALRSIVGICYEDYKADPKHEPEINEKLNAPKAFEWNPPVEFWTALYNHIYVAVYEAVKKAWSE